MNYNNNNNFNNKNNNINKKVNNKNNNNNNKKINNKNNNNKKIKNKNNNINKESQKKKENVLKLLKTIGIDTRFISYTQSAIYINDQRFSKFSKKRQETFKKYYSEMDIISSTLFQKICIRASKVLSEKLTPKDKILLLKQKNNVDFLLKIVLEPYSRKYGVTIIESNIESMDIDSNFNKNTNINIDILKDINIVAKSTTLDEKVENILSNLFSGNGIGNINSNGSNNLNFVYPFINISNNWIDSFNNYIEKNYKNNNNSKNKSNSNFNYNSDSNSNSNSNIENIFNKNKKINYKNNDKYKNHIIIAASFMEFLDEIIPQYKENFLKSANYIKNNINQQDI